jgi:type I restriction enzyme S subunit
MPSIPEQQKIADCLSSLDELIELQAKQLEALQAHKKGLMQQLFPREGETTPRLRFPEFRDAGPWEVKQLGEILKEVVKESIDSDAYEVVSVKLHAKGLERSGRKPVINPNGRPYYIVKAGEILIGKQNFHNGSIALVQNEYDGLVASNAIFHLETRRYDDKRFLIAYLARPSFYVQVSDLIGGTGQKEISKQLLFALKISIPGLPEQQKIADCLSSLDELIEHQAKQLEALQADKKGLMQQLFPQEVG